MFYELNIESVCESVCGVYSHQSRCVLAVAVEEEKLADEQSEWRSVREHGSR